MDSAYINQDIWGSTWVVDNPTHEMWPEYMGHIPESAGDIDFSLHGSYNCGCVAMPTLCKVPNSDDLVAVWIAIDGDRMDEAGNYYFRLYASYSGDGGHTWQPQVKLIDDFMYSYTENVYPQAAVINQTLIVAVQTDATTGTFVMGGDNESGDNLYQGFIFDLPLPVGVPEVSHNTHMTVYPNPAVDRLNVTLSNNTTMTVYNITGQAVMNVEGHVGANTLDISSLTSGIYFISAGNDTQKFIVK